GRALSADGRAPRCGRPALALCTRASNEIPRRFRARRAHGLYPAGPGLWPLGLGAVRAVLVPALPAVALRALFLRWRGDRRVRHRARPDRTGWVDGAALGVVEPRGPTAICGVDRAHGRDDGPPGVGLARPPGPRPSARCA